MTEREKIPPELRRRIMQDKHLFGILDAVAGIASREHAPGTTEPRMGLREYLIDIVENPRGGLTREDLEARFQAELERLKDA